jgi:hypothetical protein
VIAGGDGAFAVNEGSAGCVFFQTIGPSNLSKKPAESFPGLRPPVGNATNAIAAVPLELSREFGMQVVIALYDDGDQGPDGNASAIDKYLWPLMAGPPPEGTLLLGERCFQTLLSNRFQFAAIASICAHEMGHLIQYKYVNAELFALRNQDRSVVRTELHADFVCGYYGACRKKVQPDWPVVIQVITQFKFGDQRVADPMHHGTPRQRGEAVQAGFLFGEGQQRTAREVAVAGLQYVRSLDLIR